MKLILSRKGFDSAAGGGPSPLLPGNRAIGAIMAERGQRDGRPFTENEATFFLALSRAIATAIENAVLWAQTERDRQKIKGLNRQLSRKVEQQTVECPDIGNDQDQLRLNWMASIRSREPAISNVDHATKVMVIVDLATRSMWEGSAFAFDHKNLSVRKL